MKRGTEGKEKETTKGEEVMSAVKCKEVFGSFFGGVRVFERKQRIPDIGQPFQLKVIQNTETSSS